MTAGIASRLGRTLIMLDEAFEVRRKEKGEVGFKSSSLQSPHIRQIINDASAVTGKPVSEIVNIVQQKMKEVEEMQKYSPLLYDIARQNAAESAVFDLVIHSRARGYQNLVKFDPVVFNQLINMVRKEHKQFFPLRQPADPSRYVFRFNPILVPTTKKELAQFNSIKTAAATSKGEFIFNTEFMQKIMDWAVIEGVRPTSKKYESNGGPIPDAYVYVEFLIVHELLHYSYGDFNYGVQMPEFSQKIHNYASDFRSNYMLVKSGYHQLPIGLFSDDINADRQPTYKQMVKLVDQELKKLPPPLQDLFKDLTQLDDHPSGGEPGEPSQQPGGEPGKDGKPSFKPGDIVQNKATGDYYKVTNVRDGKLVTQKATAAEVAQARGETKESVLVRKGRV